MKKSKKISSVNTNGINICDSIVMSVKKRRVNLRQLESVGIALTGFVSVIMAFLSMFDFNYDRPSIIFAAVIFSLIYIFLSLVGKKAVWLIIASVVGFTVFAYKVIDTLALGYKYVYNVIYHKAFLTDINYYKFLKPELEEQATTAFFIMCIWLLAVVIYYFTICHPNPILPIVTTFPVIEIGLYNGIELPVFWGVLVVAYWLALFAMSTIDLGEYSGGSGGFVRKDNLFFPKRQMRLKVTEACGVFVILSVLVVSVISSAVMAATHYKRSDELNRKRVDIRDAVTSFSLSNLADSISAVTSAFGLTFKYEDHKLGNVDHLKYKNTIDLTVNVDKPYGSAIYLKDYTGSVYGNNEWNSLDDSVYDQEIFKDFKDHEMYPQLFPGIINTSITSPVNFNTRFTDDGTVIVDSQGSSDNNVAIDIKSEMRGNRSFTPYGVIPAEGYEYDNDLNLKSQKNDDWYSYYFCGMDTEAIGYFFDNNTRNVINADDLNPETSQEIIDLAKKYDLISYDNYITIDLPFTSSASYLIKRPAMLLAEILQIRYRDFVYENYLQLPNDNNMSEIRTAYSELLSIASDAKTPAAKLEVLTAIREKMASEVSYSLYPGKTPSNRDFVNYFLLENKKGFCMHYATSGVVLARMAGIPARYATGYIVVGDDFNDSNRNDDGSYTIELHDNRSHAWTEIYIDGYGWVPFEFTAGYSSQTIDTSPSTSTTEPSTETTVTAATQETTEAAETQEKSENSNNTGEKKHNTVTSVVTTTKAAGLVKPGSGKDSHEGTLVLGKIQILLMLIGLLLFVIAAVFIRRKVILYFRNKHFTTGTNENKLAYLYEYTEQLLNNLDISKDHQSYNDFANDVEKWFGGVYFEEGEFSNFVSTALDSEFGNITPSDDDINKAKTISERIAIKSYNRSNIIKKIIMKFISVLI
ncbi:MAG TPA: transglutaminase-like domain-containing protein [Ruminococcus sp.]|nr:transglutaminase-like domain-containing protein [Ruminococcus sp.]